ncbi:hypothetical protein Y1Q_0004215 [Alligator mississippiensis]|uniref:Ig-like domain-containing protein n=1 Tax=Alligator mississippiensis TaxID=8496 RepID=A0A151P772_ALLMI|nr:hypothetical protein Y1Q_0004215 [Alligator mississippiensis]
MATVGGQMDAWAMRLGGLLLPLLFLGTVGSQLQVTTAPSSTARMGSGALLQCRFVVGGPVVLDCLRVTWYFSEEKVAWTQQHHGETILHLLAAPTISIPRKPVVADAETSLLCHMGRFYPEDVDVDVAWLRDGQVLKGSTRSSPKRNADGTFNLTLTYTFTPAHSDTGSVFSCHVRHDALEQPLQEDVSLDIQAPDQTGAVVGAVLGILIGAGVAASAAIYFWRKRKKGSEEDDQSKLPDLPTVKEVKKRMKSELRLLYEVKNIQRGLDGQPVITFVAPEGSTMIVTGLENP